MHSIRANHRLFHLFILASLLVHACFMLVMYISSYVTSQSSFVPDSRPVEIEFVKVAPSKTKTLDSKRQIVQSEDSSNEVASDNAFLSDKTRSFDRQTIASNVNTFNKAARGNASQNQKAQADSPKAVAKSSPKNIKLSDIGMGPAVEATSNAPKAAAQNSLQGIREGDAHSKGLSATNDYVEDVALGDFTQLNTVEYKFYGFFHRIRQRLEQHWGRSIQEKADTLFRAGRRLPASENYVTNLQVSLNAKGEIVGVKILGASGVKELDDAAIESFNQAGPFPNPPSELLVNGQATIDWGFVVKG